ncbi:hypothetical protein [Rugamonas apoptosis]|uniref:Uncharacterized protein n=1 Tax=Rugamonas apoptosis TaxID=2758570 RepID=A0A7W2FAT4_9BURK|nr:hypothetical protein [Rugamonas apoptosis]MBA5688285.1 hypothetical protein [Rugamonas apoptosis]
MKKYVAVLLLALGNMAPVRAEDAPAAPGAVAQASLASKLVEGSPWRFDTKFESTIVNFRFSDDGKLQRQSARSQAWSDFPIGDNQTGTFNTSNGHTITYSLDAAGNPIAVHSKHAATFKSVK